MIGIYKITNPSGKIYIGQSLNIKKRFNTYKKNRCKGQPAIYNSLLKYGFDKHIFEVLLECDIKELNKHERDYQDMYDVLGENGLNCKLTKEGDRNGIASDETRLKMSKSAKGNLSHLGRNHSEETKIKISEANKNNTYRLGKRHSEKTKNKMSINKKGKPAKNKRSIYCILDGDKTIFTSITEASIFFDVLITSIVNNINNDSKIVNTNKGKIKFFKYE